MGTPFLLLVGAIALLGFVVVLGAFLGGRYLLLEQTPARRWPGLLHGAGGLAGFALLVVALGRQAPSAHAARMGAGAFGVFSGGLIAAALVAGALILLAHWRGRALSVALIATHGMLAIVGYTLLVTYLTMLR
jgi:hypothetical protein